MPTATPVSTPRGRGTRGAGLAWALCGAIVTLGVVLAAGGFSADGARPRSFVPAFPDLGVDRTTGLVATISASVVVVRAVAAPGGGGDDGGGDERTGTGIVIGSDRILTNASLVGEGDMLTITTSDGTVVAAELLGRDPETDLAVLDAEGSDAPTARIGSADAVGVGTWVLAVGASAAQRRWADEGIVSGVELIRPDPDGHVLAGMLGTDLGGSSDTGGGTLLDETGAVVAVLSRSVPGHAIPIDAARTVADQIMATGRARHGWLGVFAADETDRDGGGAVVRAVTPGGPAATAGLEDGDIVTAIGDRAVPDLAGLMSTISRFRPGDPVEVTVWRAGERHRIKASLGERPADAVGLAALQA